MNVYIYILTWLKNINRINLFTNSCKILITNKCLRYFGEGQLFDMLNLYIFTLQNPGEIFILLKDELIGEILEVEFISSNKRLRTRPARWSKSVWCMKAAGEKLCVLIIIKPLPEFLSCDLW